MSEVARADFRRTMSTFATGVTVVTTMVGDVLHGMTANAFASVSLAPPLVLVCVDRAAGLHPLLPRSGVFAVSVLSVEQGDLSVWFASRRPHGVDQFAHVPWHLAPVFAGSVGRSRVPRLPGRGRARGRRPLDLHREVLDHGDLKPGVEPLIWYGSGYHRLA